METLKIRQGRKYWYVGSVNTDNAYDVRVREIHITHGNISTRNNPGDVPNSFECFGRLRVEDGVAYIEGY